MRLRTQTPLLFDAYRRSRETGSFILVDEATNNTVAAGMITGPSQHNSQVVWHSGRCSARSAAPAALTVWLTGLSASGKSSVAAELERRLVASGRPAYLLDGDNLRHGLNADLGFTAEDRAENVRRVGEVAKLLADAGVIAIVSLVSPVRRRPQPRPRRPTPTAACRSSRSSSTPRSRSARPATPRACTPRPAPARSRTSPASPTPTRRPSPRTCGCAPRTATPPPPPTLVQDLVERTLG